MTYDTIHFLSSVPSDFSPFDPAIFGFDSIPLLNADNSGGRARGSSIYIDSLAAAVDRLSNSVNVNHIEEP